MRAMRIRGRVVPVWRAAVRTGLGALGMGLVIAVLAASNAGAADRGKSPGCEPSRACALEMAREAGRRNHAISGDIFQYVMALMAIGDLQFTAGDREGYAATLAQMRKTIDRYVRANDEVGYAASLARMQARAGLIPEARATARSMRNADRRDEAWRAIARELAAAGRWPEALEVAQQVRNHEQPPGAGWGVMQDLISTGRRDWVREAAPVLTPGHELTVLARVELVNGDFAAARAAALRIEDVDQRLTVFSQIGDEAANRARLDELALAARQMAVDAAGAKSEFMRGIYYKIAVEWLTAAGQLDEAIRWLPKLDEDEQPSAGVDIVRALAQAGEIGKAEARLASLDADYRAEAAGAIEAARVMAGDGKLDPTLPGIAERHVRIEALEYLGEHLPDARRDELRAVLRQAVVLAQRTSVEYRDAWLTDLAALQAKRGFYEDAMQTVLLLNDTQALLAAYGVIGVAQAKQGALADARATFVIAEARVRKHGFTGEDHAWLTESIAKAGLLPEAYAQVQAMCRRAKGEYWFNQLLDPVITGHLEAGQARRAFEIAAMLSEHQSGDPHYFLVIATALADP